MRSLVLPMHMMYKSKSLIARNGKPSSIDCRGVGMGSQLLSTYWIRKYGDKIARFIPVALYAIQSCSSVLGRSLETNVDFVNSEDIFLSPNVFHIICQLYLLFIQINRHSMFASVNIGHNMDSRLQSIQKKNVHKTKLNLLKISCCFLKQQNHSINYNNTFFHSVNN